jgi:2-hydroxy-3-keto-5-methylthiopentenyl-1-phosphate phosphatase
MQSGNFFNIMQTKLKNSIQSAHAYVNLNEGLLASPSNGLTQRMSTMVDKSKQIVNSISQFINKLSLTHTIPFWLNYLAQLFRRAYLWHLVKNTKVIIVSNGQQTYLGKLYNYIRPKGHIQIWDANSRKQDDFFYHIPLNHNNISEHSNHGEVELGLSYQDQRERIPIARFSKNNKKTLQALERLGLFGIINDDISSLTYNQTNQRAVNKV